MDLEGLVKQKLLGELKKLDNPRDLTANFIYSHIVPDEYRDKLDFLKDLSRLPNKNLGSLLKLILSRLTSSVNFESAGLSNIGSSSSVNITFDTEFPCYVLEIGSLVEHMDRETARRRLQELNGARGYWKSYSSSQYVKFSTCKEGLKTWYMFVTYCRDKDSLENIKARSSNEFKIKIMPIEEFSNWIKSFDSSNLLKGNPWDKEYGNK